MELGPSGEPCAMLVADERSPVLIELDPKYMDVIVKRWKEFTGGRAVPAHGNCLLHDVDAARQN